MQFQHYDPNTRLGFINQVSTKPNATFYSGRSIREHHPDAPMILSLDGNANVTEYLQIADLLHAEVIINKQTLGYPKQPYGYRKDGLLEWFNRFYICAIKLPVTHFMMWEDDMLFTSPVDFDEEWDCAGHNITHGNEIHPALLDLIEDFSDKKPKTKFYGTGGGSIFAKEPLVKHYHEVYQWLDGNVDWIQHNFYPTLGWMDCFTTILYMLCGCDYDVNPFLYNLDPHDPDETELSRANPDILIDSFKDTPYNIIHNYKAFYTK